MSPRSYEKKIYNIPRLFIRFLVPLFVFVVVFFKLRLEIRIQFAVSCQYLTEKENSKAATANISNIIY